MIPFVWGGTTVVRGFYLAISDFGNVLIIGNKIKEVFTFTLSSKQNTRTTMFEGRE